MKKKSRLEGIRMINKESKILLVMCSLVFLAGAHEAFIGSGIRLDIYMFYEYINSKGVLGRYLSNIIYDLSGLITRSTLLFILYTQSRTKNLKKIFFAFLIISIADIVDYILFFQKLAHIKLFVLIFLVILSIYPKNNNKQQ